MILEKLTIVGHSVGAHIGAIISDMFRNARIEYIAMRRAQFKQRVKRGHCRRSLVDKKNRITNSDIYVAPDEEDSFKSPFFHNNKAHFDILADAMDYGLIGVLIGADPAGPWYKNEMPPGPLLRIRPGIAIYTMIIHSNAELLGLELLVGDVDLFPNGGKNQTFCRQTGMYNYLAKQASKYTNH